MGQKAFKYQAKFADPTLVEVEVSREDLTARIERGISAMGDRDFEKKELLVRDLRTVARTSQRVAFGNWLLFPLEDREKYEEIMGSVDDSLFESQRYTNLCGCPLAQVSEWIPDEKAYYESTLTPVDSAVTGFFETFDNEMRNLTGQQVGIAVIK